MKKTVRIIDECWLDVSGSVGLFGDGEQIAEQIRRTIKHELGITVSIGYFQEVFRLVRKVYVGVLAILIPMETRCQRLYSGQSSYNKNPN